MVLAVVEKVINIWLFGTVLIGVGAIALRQLIGILVQRLEERKLDKKLQQFSTTLSTAEKRQLEQKRYDARLK